MAGHLGVTKTFRRISKYLFGPVFVYLLLIFVALAMCVSQRIGKPNQKVPAAPLYPIPVYRRAVRATHC